MVSNFTNVQYIHHHQHKLQNVETCTLTESTVLILHCNWIYVKSSPHACLLTVACQHESGAGLIIKHPCMSTHIIHVPVSKGVHTLWPPVKVSLFMDCWHLYPGCLNCAYIFEGWVQTCLWHPKFYSVPHNSLENVFDIIDNHCITFIK